MADFHLNDVNGVDSINEDERTDDSDAGSTHGLLKVVDIVKDNEGAFPAKFKGASLQVGLSTCHLIGGDFADDQKQQFSRCHNEKLD